MHKRTFTVKASEEAKRNKLCSSKGTSRLNTQIQYPYRMYAEFADGSQLYFDGFSEEECMQYIADAQEEHGECLYYTGYEDENYVGGEYIDR